MHEREVLSFTCFSHVAELQTANFRRNHWDPLSGELISTNEPLITRASHIQTHTNRSRHPAGVVTAEVRCQVSDLARRAQSACGYPPDH